MNSGDSAGKSDPMSAYDWKIYRVGNTERWYDRRVRSWAIRRVDADGNQIGEASYVYTVREAKAEQERLATTPADLDHSGRILGSFDPGTGAIRIRYPQS